MIYFVDFSQDRKEFDVFFREEFGEKGYDISTNDIIIVNKSKAHRVLGTERALVFLEPITLDIHRKGITPVDIYQKAYLHHLENEGTPLVTCLGPAGSGKTYLTMYYIFESLENKRFQRAIISKPLVGVSESRYMGTLPGGMEEKLAPFLSSFYDIAQSLNRVRTFEDYLEREIIVFEPVEFMRGRSFENTVVFLDEVQSLTNHELLTLGTRIGKNSKLILSGDPRQSDRQECVSIKDFVYHPAYLESPYSVTAELHKRMRSPITEIFEEILA